METSEKENALNQHNKENVYSYNPVSENIFQDIKTRIHSVLGAGTEILHRGSTALGIAGQREVDIYIPVAVEQMQEFSTKLEKLFGTPPKSIYESERIKFIQDSNGIRVEIMIVNKNHKSWIEGEAAFEHIKNNEDALRE